MSFFLSIVCVCACVWIGGVRGSMVAEISYAPICPHTHISAPKTNEASCTIC